MRPDTKVGAITAISTQPGAPAGCPPMRRLQMELFVPAAVDLDQLRGANTMSTREPVCPPPVPQELELERIARTLSRSCHVVEGASFDDLLHAIDLSDAQSRGSKADLGALSVEIESCDDQLGGRGPTGLNKALSGANNTREDLGVQRVKLGNPTT